MLGDAVLFPADGGDLGDPRPRRPSDRTRHRAGNIRAHYSPWLPRPIGGLLLAANIINLGAMAAALQFLVGGPMGFYIVGFAVGSPLLGVFVSYERYVSILKWTSFVLLAYVAVPT